MSALIRPASGFGPGAQPSLTHALPDSRNPKSTKRPWIILVWMACVFAISACIALPFALVHSFSLAGDLREMRDSVLATRSVGGRWRKQFEVRAGGTSITLLRLIAPGRDLPPEARLTLSAVQSAGVGIYRWHGRGDPAIAGFEQLHSAMTVMTTRGWTRVVSVRDRDHIVFVMMRDGASTSEDVEFCVAVITGGKLVLAGGRAATAPLEELVATHMNRAR